MEYNLTDLLTSINPLKIPNYCKLIGIISKYECIKIIVKQKPWYMTKCLHEKLCYLFFGVDIKSKTVTFNFSTIKDLTDE